MVYLSKKLADPTDKAIVFTSRIAYLSKADDRRCVIIPKDLGHFTGRSTLFRVILRPIGSLQ